MMTKIAPEPGGESQGILRVELSMPLSVDEVLSLREWLEDNGWPIECDQIDAFFLGEDWTG